MDNLNTHREQAVTETFGRHVEHRLWNRFTVHYTPKHGSWPNLGRQQVATLGELRGRTAAWNRWANRTQLKIDWRFSTTDARRVFGYQRIVTHESKH
jgi:hypothetical protein